MFRNDTKQTKLSIKCYVNFIVMAVCSLLFFDSKSVFANTQASVIRITTCQELQNITYKLTANYVLGNDIDCTATNPQNPKNKGSMWDNGGKGFMPIGVIENQSLIRKTFEGNFDGRGYKIIGLYINRPDFESVGLFTLAGSYFGKNLTYIKNVSISNCYIKGKRIVGALMGRALTINLSNIYVQGMIIGNEWSIGGIVGILEGGGILKQSSANVYVRGEGQGEVGGLVGSNQGEIRESFSKGFVTGSRFLGGLVGSNWNDIYDSYSNATISVDYLNLAPYRAGGIVGYNEFTDSVIQNTYFAGAIFKSIPDTKYKQSGILGGYYQDEFNDYTTFKVIDSYWDKQISGIDTLYPSKNINGKNTIELKTRTTFSNWNFQKTWSICSGRDYPRLQWENVSCNNQK